MKKLIIIFLVCYACGFGLLSLWQHIVKPRAQTVHVFFEPYATNPAFSQMIEFARLPKETPKIIAWHRFPNRKNVLDLNEYNAREIDIPSVEGAWKHSTRKVFAEVYKIYSANPKTRFVFYTNLTHQNILLAPFLDALPKENIEHIHLYEDGYGELFKRSQVYSPEKCSYKPDKVLQMPAAFAGKIPWETIFNISIHKHYPATYHLMHSNKLSQEPKLAALTAWLKDADIDNIDFESLRDLMSEEQKQVVYKLAGFDYDKFYPLMKDQTTIVYTFGFLFKNRVLEKAEFNLLTTLREKPPFNSQTDKPITWFYKLHPSFSAKNRTADMKNLFPDMIEIPAQIPFEVLILAGLKPTLTAGYGSSLYYSLTPKDVLVYVKRKGHDSYLKFLLEKQLIHPKQVVDLTHFTDEAISCRNAPSKRLGPKHARP